MNENSKSDHEHDIFISLAWKCSSKESSLCRCLNKGNEHATENVVIKSGGGLPLFWISAQVHLYPIFQMLSKFNTNPCNFQGDCMVAIFKLAFTQEILLCNIVRKGSRKASVLGTISRLLYLGALWTMPCHSFIMTLEGKKKKLQKISCIKNFSSMKYSDFT